MAPEVGLEPTTSRLTAARSTIELLWNPKPYSPAFLRPAGHNPEASSLTNAIQWLVSRARNVQASLRIVKRILPAFEKAAGKTPGSGLLNPAGLRSRRCGSDALVAGFVTANCVVRPEGAGGGAFALWRRGVAATTARFNCIVSAYPLVCAAFSRAITSSSLVCKKTR